MWRTNDTIKKTLAKNISFYYRKKAGLSQKAIVKLPGRPSRISIVGKPK